MRTKFTSEKNKQLKNEKKSMFNFKNVSLMKKQVFTLMMAFALVMGLSVSAWAQLGDAAADNSDAAPYIMVAGSSHTLEVSSNATNTVWTLHNADTGDEIVSADDVATVTQTDQTFRIDWTRNSFGSYYAQVEETRESCTTTRRFYMTIIDFDIFVYAANSDGSVATTAAQLAYCGNGTTENYGDMPASSPGDAFSNVFGPEGNNGDLEDYVGTSSQTTRYIGFQVIWNLGTSGASAPTVESMRIDYLVTLADAGGSAYVDNTDFVSFHTETTASGSGTLVAFSSTDLNGLLTTDFGTGTEKGPNAFVEVVANDRWSSSVVTDIKLDFSANNVTLYATDDGTGSPIGVEADGYVNTTTSGSTTVMNASNVAATQTIQLAPATSPISVTAN